MFTLKLFTSVMLVYTFCSTKYYSTDIKLLTYLLTFTCSMLKRLSLLEYEHEYEKNLIPRTEWKVKKECVHRVHYAFSPLPARSLTRMPSCATCVPV